MTTPGKFAEKITRPGLAEELSQKEALERMIRMVDPQPHEIALDLGTGSGNTAIALATRVRKVFALDLDNEVLKRCRRNLRTAALIDRVELRRHDAADALPFKDASLDIVSCRAAFHYFPDGEHVLREVTRALRPGGRFNLMNWFFSAEARDAWKAVAKQRGTNLAGFRTKREQLESIWRIGLRVVDIVDFRFRRSFNEWLAEVPAARRRRLRDQVLALPETVLGEVQFRVEPYRSSEGPLGGWVWSYPVFELVAVKP